MFFDENENKNHEQQNLWKTVSEFREYINLNESFIPNYSERYNHDEAVSLAVTESIVNEIISRRMAKKKQMRCTQKGAHHLLQVRTKTLNNELEDSFKRWYPKMKQNNTDSLSLPT